MSKPVSREEFLGVFADELRGLVAESFALARHGQPTDHSANGKAIVDQMRRGQDLLARIWLYFQANEPVRPRAVGTNGLGQQATKGTSS